MPARKNEALRRYLSALTVCLFLITVVASFLAGARVEIVVRALIVVFIGVVVSRVLLATVEAWDTTQVEEDDSHSRLI